MRVKCVSAQAHPRPTLLQSAPLLLSHYWHFY